MIEILNTIGNLSPLGIAGMLAYIIYLLVNKRGPVKTISDNHLSGLPVLTQHVEQILESNRRQEEMLGRVLDGISYLKGRINGRTG